MLSHREHCVQYPFNKGNVIKSSHIFLQREVTMKNGIILIMCLILQTSALSVEFAGGTGEPNDPYQIATVEQLISIGSNSDLLEKSYVLVADLDMDPNLPGGRIFEDALIATDDSDGVGSYSGLPFRGVLDGRGHTIANLHIDGEYGYDAGLFGILSGLVKDLRLTDVVVSGSPCGAIAGRNDGMILRCSVTGLVSGGEDVGGLVGTLSSGSLVECRAQIQVTGVQKVGGMIGDSLNGTLMRCEVQGQISGDTIIGGLSGRQTNNSIIECRFEGTVMGVDYVGGLVGFNSGGYNIILRSSANCDVIAEGTVGGLVGFTLGTSQVSDCYAQGTITGSVLGGLAGKADEDQYWVNSYAACEFVPLKVGDEEPLVGGLFGDVWGSFLSPKTVSCFWDAELSQTVNSIGSDPLELGTGLTTDQMQDQEVFQNAGWDFNQLWMICEGDYPRLQWEAVDCNEPQQ